MTSKSGFAEVSVSNAARLGGRAMFAPRSQMLEKGPSLGRLVLASLLPEADIPLSAQVHQSQK
jgi:hypothetical protein